jgi:hypothetical protein
VNQEAVHNLTDDSWLYVTFAYFDYKLWFLDEFMKEQLHQYNVGKRHLANMMGEDPNMFTQEDVDVSTADVKSSYVLYKD